MAVSGHTLSLTPCQNSVDKNTDDGLAQERSETTLGSVRAVLNNVPFVVHSFSALNSSEEALL